MKSNYDKLIFRLILVLVLITALNTIILMYSLQTVKQAIDTTPTVKTAEITLTVAEPDNLPQEKQAQIFVYVADGQPE